MRVLLVAPLILGLWLGAWSCGPSHCGYNGGDSACAARDPGTPFCDLCSQDNDGCLAEKPIDAACVLVGDSGAVDTLPPTTLPTTTNPEPTAPEPTTQGPTSPPPDTTEPTNPDPSTTNDPTQTTDASTTSGMTTDASTSEHGSSTTADDTTSGASTTADDATSGESTTTSDDTTGPPPPMCGNDVVEGDEVCDGSDFAGKLCTDYPGKGGGMLMCDAQCATIDPAGCCLANNQACSDNGQCCNNSCKFDLLMGKKICK